MAPEVFVVVMSVVGESTPPAVRFRGSMVMAVPELRFEKSADIIPLDVLPVFFALP